MDLGFSEVSGLVRALWSVLMTGGTLTVTFGEGGAKIRRTPGAPRPASNNRALTGYVLDLGGKPLVGVKITIDGKRKQVVSDRSGRFSFKKLEPRRYLISLRHRGHVPKSTTVDLKGRQLTTRDIMLTSQRRRAVLDKIEFAPNPTEHRLGETNGQRGPLRKAGKVIIDS